MGRQNLCRSGNGGCLKFVRVEYDVEDTREKCLASLMGVFTGGIGSIVGM